MATLDEIVENSLYTEVKKLRDGISLVMDPKTDRIYLRKVLDVFSVPVFEYLNSHTDVHIPRIKAFWEEGDKLVVIEEYIQGTTLEELLEKGQDYKGDKFEFGEIKRIQTIDDDYQLYGDLKDQWRQVGNAVPSKLAFVIATEIKKYL